MSLSQVTDALSVTSIPSTKKTTTSNDTSSARDEFSNLMSMSPAERMRALILEQLGLNENDLQKMPADQRAQVENKISQIIQAKLGVGTQQTAESSGVDATTDVATAAASAAGTSVAASSSASTASNDSSSTGSDGQPATDQADRLLAMIRQAAVL